MTYKASLIDDTAQNELELSDDTDHFGDRELFENQYYEVKARFNELLHPVVGSPPFRCSSSHSSLSRQSNISTRSYTSSTHIKLPPLHCQPLEVTHVVVTLQRHF
jgi:hypothetical protein